VAAAGLLSPQRFGRRRPQPGYRSGDDQGAAGGDPRPAPLHGRATRGTQVQVVRASPAIAPTVSRRGKGRCRYE
jgi:hypothetical protein